MQMYLETWKYMFRSLAHISYFFFCRYIWGSCPPNTKKLATLVAVRDCGFELVDHPPDLAPSHSDYFLFPNMNKTLGWEAASAVRTIPRIRNQDESFYTTKIQALLHRWKKCVDGRWDCVENYTLILVKFDHCIIVSLWTFQPTLVSL